mgnify:CR=1 FL=1
MVKYINKDNFDYFSELFNNYDIFSELFYLLSYELASCHPDFNNLKELWLEKNFNKLPIYYEEFKPYLVYKVLKNEYYIINNKVYGYHKSINIDKELPIYKNKNIKNEHAFMISKYIFTLAKNNKYYKNEEFRKLLLNNINYSVYFCNLNLIKYLMKYYDKYFIENYTIDNKCIENVIINDEIEIIEYLLKFNIIEKKFNNISLNFANKINKININNVLFYAVINYKYDIIKYLINKGADINNENLLMIILNDNHTDDRKYKAFKFSSESQEIEYKLKMIKLLIDNNFNINIFGYDAIIYCGKLPIYKYIIDNFNEINYNKLYENVLNVNINIAKYLENNYKIDDTLLLNSGSINIIKNKNKYNLNDLINIMDYNTEDECIEFFKYIIQSISDEKNSIKQEISCPNEKNYIQETSCLDENSLFIQSIFNLDEKSLFADSRFHLDDIQKSIIKFLEIEEIVYGQENNYNNFINKCIKSGYLKLIIYLSNNVKDINYRIHDIIKYSKSEEDVLYFINIYSKYTYHAYFEEVIINSINKGYINIIKCLKDYIKRNYNWKLFFELSIENENIEILKYLLSINNIYPERLLEKALKIGNIEIFKYLYETSMFDSTSKRFIQIDILFYFNYDLEMIKYLINIFDNDENNKICEANSNAPKAQGIFFKNSRKTSFFLKCCSYK